MGLILLENQEFIIMGRRKKEVAPEQPTELGALKEVVGEFMNRFDVLDNEIDLLQEDQKQLVEDFSDRLDIKTLKSAIRTVKIKKKVNHLDTFDSFVHILDERENV